jgi:hypothetical protein
VLALLYLAERRPSEAEPLLKEALETGRAVLGPRHPETLVYLNNLALLYGLESSFSSEGG